MNESSEVIENHSSLCSAPIFTQSIEFYAEITTITTTTTTDITTNESEKKHITFFTNLRHKFYEIQLLEDDQIPTEYFLECCHEIFSIFDQFGTLFLPIKVDVNGNINKLKTKYSTDPNKYHTLQAIIQSEIHENQTKAKNSATDALLWLKRAIWFLREFLFQFLNKENTEMIECVHLSYENSLKKYHNWIARGLVSLAMRALPTKEHFLKTLAIHSEDYENNHISFERQIELEIESTYKSIDKIMLILNQFYNQNCLDK